jgi:NarL family two-component system response regulator LiaR
MLSAKPIRVLVVDDYEIIRVGLRSVLSCYPDIEVVGEIAHSRNVLQACDALHPDVILMDFTLDDDDGTQITRRLRQDFPHIKVIILTCMFDFWSLQAIIGADATGYLIKNASSEQIATAVRQAVSGGTVFAPEVMRFVLRSNLGLELHPSALSERERDVLTLIVQGCTNKEIGLHLGLSPYTVKNHVSHLLTKLNAASRAEAAAIALKLQLVHLD